MSSELPTTETDEKAIEVEYVFKKKAVMGRLQALTKNVKSPF